MFGRTKIAGLLSVCCLMSWATLAFGTVVKYQKIISADIRSIEAGIVTIPATFDNGESSTVHEAKVKGTLVLTKHMDVDVSVPWASDDQQVIQYAKDNYCSNDLTGTLIFNAGRHISIDMGIGQLSDKSVTVVELLVATLPKTVYSTKKITVRCK